MRIKDGFVLREVAGQYVVIATGEASKNFHGMIKLNITGKEIWQGLQEGLDKAAIVQRLQDKFEVESEKVSATVSLTVSITENNEIAFVMYPNPAKDYVTIESAKAADVKIYSISGQMLSEQNISEGINTIDLSDLNAGIYFISVNGTMVKVVKK